MKTNRKLVTVLLTAFVLFIGSNLSIAQNPGTNTALSEITTEFSFGPNIFINYGCPLNSGDLTEIRRVSDVFGTNLPLNTRVFTYDPLSSTYNIDQYCTVKGVTKWVNDMALPIGHGCYLSNESVTTNVVLTVYGYNGAADQYGYSETLRTVLYAPATNMRHNPPIPTPNLVSLSTPLVDPASGRNGLSSAKWGLVENSGYKPTIGDYFLQWNGASWTSNCVVALDSPKTEGVAVWSLGHEPYVRVNESFWFFTTNFVFDGSVYIHVWSIRPPLGK